MAPSPCFDASTSGEAPHVPRVFPLSHVARWLTHPWTVSRLVSDTIGPDGIRVHLVPGADVRSGNKAWEPQEGGLQPSELDIDPRLRDSKATVVVDVCMGPRFPLREMPARLHRGGLITVMPILVTQVWPRLVSCGVTC